MSEQEKLTGTVFDIQRFSVHDGPGIRTIVFFKGCPLRCRWCSNPESQEWVRQLVYLKQHCIHCGKCLEACPQSALDFSNGFFVDKSKCDLCGKCVQACYPGALNMEGEIKTVSALISELRKDSIHYRRSGGGVTLSGGEALAQADFAVALLKACKDEGWHTAVETAANISREKLALTLPYLDMVLLDIKHADSLKHEQYVGKPNDIILENAHYIANTPNVELVIRVPVIPGFNDQPDEIAAIAKIADNLPGVQKIHLLPYHRMGENKYDYLQRDYEMKGIKPSENSHIGQLKIVVEQNSSLTCQIGG